MPNPVVARRFLFFSAILSSIGCGEIAKRVRISSVAVKDQQPRINMERLSSGRARESREVTRVELQFRQTIYL
jgi:hypothetical protein